MRWDRVLLCFWPKIICSLWTAEYHKQFKDRCNCRFKLFFTTSSKQIQKHNHILGQSQLANNITRAISEWQNQSSKKDNISLGKFKWNITEHYFGMREWNWIPYILYGVFKGVVHGGHIEAMLCSGNQKPEQTLVQMWQKPLRPHLHLTATHQEQITPGAGSFPEWPLGWAQLS